MIKAPRSWLVSVGIALASCVPAGEGVQVTVTEASAVPRVHFIQVAPEVSLEVLEWSSTGEPLVLLPGAAHSAHAFVDLAPQFTDRFRVLGITRRRVGASSTPSQQFGIDELVSDIIAVLDTFRIQAANFIGHSFGGAELSYLALRHPGRVQRMVYLDGSWDFARVYNSPGWWDPWPDLPVTPEDSASPQALAAYFARTWGPLFPIEEIEAINRFDPSGKLVARDPNVGSMFKEMIGPTLDTLDFSRIAVPTLTVRSIPLEVSDLFRGYAAYDPINKHLADAAFQRWSSVVVGEGNRFVSQVRGVQDLRLERAHHEVLVTEPERFVPTVRDFLNR